MTIPEKDIQALKDAKILLEGRSFAVRVMDVIGAPIEKGYKMLPRKWSNGVEKTVEISLDRALDVAVNSLNPKDIGKESRNGLHKLAVTGTGMVGGAFGLPALLIELPITTVIMLRSVAEIARSLGEDPNTFETRMECLEVFALGSLAAKVDDASDAGYYAVRSALAKAVSDAARFLVKTGAANKSAPVMVRLIQQIATRFGIVVSQKAAAAAIPVVGAAGGSLVNAIFMDHFQGVAKGHFTIRQLEKTYGKEEIESLFEQF